MRDYFNDYILAQNNISYPTGFQVVSKQLYLMDDMAVARGTLPETISWSHI